MKTIILLFAIAALSRAQATFTHEYTTTGANQKVTLHLPSNANKTARMVGLTVYCATACTFPLARDGSAPTSTAATAAKLNDESAAAAVIPYNNSDVGSGTTIKNYNVAAGEEKIILLTDKGILRGKNLTVTPSISGAVVYYQWKEY